MFYITVRVYDAIQAQSYIFKTSKGDFKYKIPNHNLVNAIVGKTILQRWSFFSYSFYVGPIPALRYTLFCPALFSMDLGLLAVILRSKPLNPTIGFR
jgi:hypothetical protein